MVSEGVQPLANQAAPAQRIVSAPSEPAGIEQPTARADPEAGKVAECLSLDAAIKANEAAALRPQSAWVQDQLASKKRELQQRKYELHC